MFAPEWEGFVDHSSLGRPRAVARRQWKRGCPGASLRAQLRTLKVHAPHCADDRAV